MTILTICTIIAAILYLGSGMAIIGSMKGEGSGASSLIRWPVLAGLVMQGYALHGEMFGEGAVNFGFGFAMSEMFFFAVIILLIETWIHRLHGQFGIVLIAAAVGTLSPLLFTGQVIPSVEWTTIFRWHLLLAIAAYAFLMIAFVHAVLMALINRRLKSPAVGETSKFLDSMPALVVMERIFFRIVVVGFLFITLTLIVGALATQEAKGVYFLFPQDDSHVACVGVLRHPACRPPRCGLARPHRPQLVLGRLRRLRRGLLRLQLHSGTGPLRRIHGTHPLFRGAGCRHVGCLDAQSQAQQS